jgi:hypothetical protein
MSISRQYALGSVLLVGASLLLCGMLGGAAYIVAEALSWLRFL